MPYMRRKIYFSTLGIVITSIIAFIIVIWVLKAPIISSYLSHKLGVNVSMGSVRISTTEMKIKKFKINNPIGARSNTALSSQNIKVSYTWNDLRSDPGIIDDIELNNVFLGIELYNATGTQNNWSQILANVDDEQDKDAKETIVKHLVINNLAVSIRGKGFFSSWKKIKEIPRLEFRNISSKDGFPTEELIEQIFDEANLGTYIKELIKQPTQVLDKIFSPFKGKP
jgi:hypothetical protein